MVDCLSLLVVESVWEVCGEWPVGPLRGSNAAFVDFVGDGCVAAAVAVCFVCSVFDQDLWLLRMFLQLLVA